MIIEFTDIELVCLLWSMKGYNHKAIAKELVVPQRLVLESLERARHKMRNTYAQTGKFVFPR